MDSFELQVQLTRLLSSLNSSKQASSEVCTFLIRNYVVQEDLYPALLEVLPRLDLNRRLNVLQFIEDFLTLIVKDQKYQSNDIIFNYAFLLISDLQKILQYVLPENPQISTQDNEKEEQKSNKKRTSIRTLANLPFSYEILVHISKLFKLENLPKLKDEYASIKMSEMEMESIHQGKPFDENQLYNQDTKPTESSHVDDYVNSNPEMANPNDSDSISKAENVANDYIPVKIKQGLENAWRFLIGKRQQSLYESLLVDNYINPSASVGSKEEEAPTDHTSMKSDEHSARMSAKTPVKTPATTKTPSLLPKQTQETQPSGVSLSSQSQSHLQAQPQNILSLSHNMILQRIEADRERQKRGKETLWEVERENNRISMSEFTYIYNTSAAFNLEEDEPAIQEMEDLYKLCNQPREAALPIQARYQTPTGPKLNPHISQAPVSASAPAPEQIHPGNKNQNGRGQHKFQPQNNKRRMPHDMVDDGYYRNGYDEHPSKRYYPDPYYDEAEWYGDYQNQYRDLRNYQNTNQRKPANANSKPRGKGPRRRGGKK